MSKKTLLFGTIASIIAVNSVFADTTTSTVTSKQYVDSQDEALYDELDEIKQGTIPAADTNYDANGGGVSVVTYTENAGVLGERYICDAAADENNDCGDDNLVTVDLLANATDNLPTITTSKMTCVDSPDCTLWAVADQTVYGRCSGHQEVCGASVAECNCCVGLYVSCAGTQCRCYDPLMVK